MQRFKITSSSDRSCGFKTMKVLIIFTIGVIFLMNVISLPWSLSLAREMLKEVSDTDENQVKVTETLVYSAVAFFLISTFSFLSFGMYSVVKENFTLTLIFLVLVLISFLISLLNYTRLLFTIKMISDVILASLLLIYVTMIKRAQMKRDAGRQRLNEHFNDHHFQEEIICSKPV